MAGKKMEGDENQRRQAAREARKSGKSPSEVNATKGGSKQRHSRPKHEPHHHEDRTSSPHRGKQESVRKSMRPNTKPEYE
ncbi:hypothetical protein GCM10010156_58990 [Planobispora rosea]|uniref:Uncharacterized protein n=1 Tax=Planobispora rosea TaxID=35762 RepID=A0A8J3S4U5_PLARO|nr:hypothetical protein [Planobispora rosea]GGS92931.1 hypothetical protein GCM10010156_58990 [Planobispora rosea]GIH87203.1 hypothetical protein Pro02_56110 [Planobispora rosea]